MNTRVKRVLATSLVVVAAATTAVLVAEQTASARQGSTRAATLADLPVLSPALSCQQVTSLNVSAAVGANVSIASATEGTSSQGAAICDVTGTIAPQIQFELQLPKQTYRQRYLQTGCGGLCGRLSISAPASAGCVPLANGSFAMASNNLGHVGSVFDGGFGIDPQLRVDFDYRADHLLALAAKAIIAHFYNKAPAYSYFDGCSTGGREGLMEAQRFPDDFDGILAGAPASIDTELNSFFQPWNGTVNTDAQGNLILPAAKLAMLHDAVLADCDTKDGLTDGLIGDPRACTFDPASLRCIGGNAATCLTDAQVETVKKLYSGPVDAQGRHLYPGGEPVGSEANWVPWFVPPPSAPQTQAVTISYGAGLNWLKFLAFDDNPPLSFTLADARFDEPTFNRVEQLAPLHDATDPDLSAFHQNGGKLILWHGWADPAITPFGTIAYYQALQDASGGLAATQQFVRLFMFPGVSHCGGGQGPSAFDLLTPLLDWVESGTPPTRIVASQTTPVVRTRPVFPYPQVARYNGSGDPNDAASFVPADPTQRFDDHIEWLGSFRKGDHLWCGWRNGRWVCSHSPV